MDFSLLIYSSFTSARLQYVLDWIFAEQMDIPFSLTTDPDVWNLYQGPKLFYGKEQQDGLRIVPHPLLEETAISIQALAVNRWKHSTILFYNQPGASVPFDLFAAVFYLVSRYEEYLPHKQDKHDRYRHEQSVAAQFSFLQQPVVDEWLQHFGRILEQQLNIRARKQTFRFLPTYDIDIAWKYLHKGARRTCGGYFKDLLRLNPGNIPERAAVLSGKRKDPYDCFAWLDELHQCLGLQPLYFMLLGTLSEYDKNADPRSAAMQTLMADLSARYILGIHPSYGSHKDTRILLEEIHILEKVIAQPVTNSRQHYIKFSLPETYEYLLAAGITDDYSMGYAGCNGFRAGTSRSFPWFDLKTGRVTSLRVHPFAFMEATSKFYARQTPAEAWQEWERLWHAVKKVNGTFISIWHNHILGGQRESKGWGELYVKTLQQSGLPDPDAAG